MATGDAQLPERVQIRGRIHDPDFKAFDVIRGPHQALLLEKSRNSFSVHPMAMNPFGKIGKMRSLNLWVINGGIQGLPVPGTEAAYQNTALGHEILKHGRGSLISRVPACCSARERSRPAARPGMCGNVNVTTGFFLSHNQQRHPHPWPGRETAGPHGRTSR